jgi:hypothetical protein
MPPSRPNSPSLLDWTVERLLDRNRRVQQLVAVASLAAFAGLGLTFTQRSFDPGSPAGTAGIALLAVSFLAFFSASLTILGAGGGR